MSMEQRNYLVTGVSRGLGIEIARALLEEEDVVVYGLSRSKPSELEALMARYPDRIRWMACDLGDSSNVRRVFKEFVGQGTPLHGYVNNAAMAYDDIVTNLNLERLRSMYEVNVFTPMMMVKGFIRHSLLHGVRGASCTSLPSACIRVTRDWRCMPRRRERWRPSPRIRLGSGASGESAVTLWWRVSWRLP